MEVRDILGSAMEVDHGEITGFGIGHHLLQLFRVLAQLPDRPTDTVHQNRLFVPQAFQRTAHIPETVFCGDQT